MEFEVCNAQTGRCIITIAYEGPYKQNGEVQAAGGGKVELFYRPAYDKSMKKLYGSYGKFLESHRRRIIGKFVEKINNEICRVEIDLERR